MSDFKTVLVKSKTLADITGEQTFAVMSGPANNTFTAFSAVSTSSSSMVFNVQIPSEAIVINREVLLESELTFTLNYRGAPAGMQVFNLGVTDAMSAFPLASLMTTLSATINNTNVSVNLQDVLPSLLKMSDPKELQKYSGMTPCYPDTAYLNYAQGVGTNNNSLASWSNQTLDNRFMPRGGFPLSAQVDQYNSAGEFVGNSPVIADSGNFVVVTITGRFTEPLWLSPFLVGNPEYNAGGIAGVNTLNLVANIDATAKRLFSSASPYNVSISLGTASNANPFTNTKLLMNFQSTQPTDLIPSRNVLPFYDFPRYLSSSGQQSPVSSGQTVTLSSNNIQLNQLPDFFIINVRIPMSQQTIQNSSSFFTINSISVNLNNQSGLLSSASQQSLWQMSVDNYSQQSWEEFSGKAFASDTSTGVGSIIPTLGSLLILSPAKDLSIPSFLSSGSIGQYNFQFEISVTNNYSYAVQPEICVITANAGLFVTQAGSSTVHTGILTKQQVLDAQEQKSLDPISTSEVTRMVGGNISQLAGSACRKVAQKLLGRKAVGTAMSAGAISGGDKLSKYY